MKIEGYINTNSLKSQQQLLMLKAFVFKAIYMNCRSGMKSKLENFWLSVIRADLTHKSKSLQPCNECGSTD